MMDRQEIIERLEELTGPDRGTDNLIAGTCGRSMPLQQALNIAPDDGCWVRQIDDQLHEIGHPRLSGMTTRDFYLPRYTASLDAAVALVEKLDPACAASHVKSGLEQVVNNGLPLSRMPVFVILSLFKKDDFHGR